MAKNPTPVNYLSIYENDMSAEAASAAASSLQGDREGHRHRR
jgi:hypothetical protein